MLKDLIKDGDPLDPVDPHPVEYFRDKVKCDPSPSSPGLSVRRHCPAARTRRYRVGYPQLLVLAPTISTWGTKPGHVSVLAGSLSEPALRAARTRRYRVGSKKSYLHPMPVNKPHLLQPGIHFRPRRVSQCAGIVRSEDPATSGGQQKIILCQ